MELSWNGIELSWNGIELENFDLDFRHRQPTSRDCSTMRNCDWTEIGNGLDLDAMNMQSTDLCRLTIRGSYRM